jgi:DNA-binding NarL/FixJ family response regulator
MDGIAATAALRRLDLRPKVIVNAIRLVATGDAMLSPSVTRTLLSHFSDPQATERRRAAAGRLATLTDRQRQVAVAIGSGASNAEVGAALFLSEATVKAHVSRLFTKLDVTNRVRSRSPCMTPTSPDPLRL